MLNRHRHLIASLLLLPLLAGCPQVQNIRIAQDTPDDIATLLEQDEFARVRNLTARNPGIDTTELQARITALEAAYENDVAAEARQLEDSDALLSAVELLSEALQRVPHSTQLRELRTAIETQRVHELRVNERNSLTARAEYLLDRQQLYAQQVNLQTPSYEQRREHAEYDNERIVLSGQLLEHARYALQADEPGVAGTCLALAKRLDETADTASLQAELKLMKQSQQETTRQATSVRNARIKRKTDRDDKQETEKLLVTTQQALDANKLQDAREAFTKIPPSTSQDSEVIAVQNTLDQAVSTRVKHLIVTGDAQYRAEKINEALKSWSEALALDPHNTEVRERTDRANKVLANLEELKRQQQK
jgi:tetratricopeptide (TPR) repeat protein